MEDHQKNAPAEYQVLDEELFLEFYRKNFWNPLVPKIPAAITPNTLTVVGQLCAVVALLASWQASKATPYLYLLSNFLIFAYMTLDNIDGAHARRTKQTSKLGEFLDHGLDGLASACILVLMGLLLELDFIWLSLICSLAAFGFASLFWEQFRTGLLVLPKLSSTEGITLVMFYQLLRFFSPESDFLSFSASTFTLGTVVVFASLVGYAVASIPSIKRTTKKGHSAWELAPLFFVMAVQVAYSQHGPAGYLPALAVGLMGANTTCHLIVLRYSRKRGPVVAPLLWLSVFPVIPFFALQNVVSPTIFATLSLAFVVLSYVHSLWKGFDVLHRNAEAA